MADLCKPPSTLSHDAFLSAYGGLYEHSPHFAEAVWPLAAGGTIDTVEGFAAALKAQVDAAGRGAQLALIRAHPELAGRLKLSDASASEQTGAGLDHCTASEMAAFLTLNARYMDKFGFPFIKAVRGFDRQQILAEFRSRVGNDPEREFAAALAEIHKIARLRLNDLAEE
ncbi:MAG: 2-oxo-4-hydroxy-4-carboxy-5-ureidoimidazoline decarboxylase [Alphaproteobacteria bacterium]|nr:2-oxo-4-hydroxy-4-carboxy-5-ureidoimidazoline decarboxylase [Alphaproteobacteria bacterium]MDE2630506.1 2-oxo-4-hydroxy-4-carboxy-5-ureidoimidazoline decarboxylase [Alphaproteobacteria bacterium]